MRLLRRFLLCATVLSAPLPALAQDKATLVADSLRIESESVLVAEGNVELFYRGKRLEASRLRYDQSAERLTIDGPIVLDDGAGEVILADQAALDADLRNGVLTSARLVLGQQLQLAATELRRVGDRYTALGRTVASSCQICDDSDVPLWEIRARRVVHDGEERRIYFDNASFRVAGVPTAWIPHLSIPDGTVSRATGFLSPTLRTTSDLGSGITLPYFIALGDSRDLTLSPFVTTRGSRTLGLRYREAFRFGAIELNGALSRDDLQPGDTRGYIDAHGSFDLPADFRLDFQIEDVSDRAYYLDYDLGDHDRLASGFEISRARRDEFVSGRLLRFRSLREDEDNDTLPSLVGDLTWERRLDFGRLGGTGGLTLETHSHRRSSGLDVDSLDDADTIADGRDMSRLSAEVDWRRDWVLPGGLVGTLAAEAGADAYAIRQDATFEGRDSRLRGVAAAELRWPLVRASADGTTDVIQPILQLAWAGASSADIPNEDAVLAEFDEGSLFALDRFPGKDAVEEGRRATLAANWTRSSAAGWSLDATVGRVIWQTRNDDFSDASGLDGHRSDWLTALKLDLPAGLSLNQRTLLDGNFGVTKAEWQVDYTADRYSLSSSYLQFRESEEEGREDPASELRLNGRYRFAANWTGSFGARYDFEEDGATWAGAGLGFRNECLAVNLSLSRRFTSSTRVSESTNIGLSVDLIGFGGGAEPGPARVCRR